MTDLMGEDAKITAAATEKRIRIHYLSNAGIPVTQRIKAVLDEHTEWLKITRDQGRLTDEYLEIEQENVEQELMLVFSTSGLMRRASNKALCPTHQKQAQQDAAEKASAANKQ